MTNPYSPPHAQQAGEDSRSSPTKGPATVLLTLLVPTFLVDGWFAYILAADLVNASKATGWSFAMIGDWGFLAKCGLVFSAHCLILVGSIKMLRCRWYWLSVVTCTLALIPVLTPGWVLGIPAGIRGLIVLRRASVRAAFAAQKRS